MGYYWSVIPGHIYDYQMDHMISTRTAAHHYYGTNGRSVLSALSGIRYILKDKNDTIDVPYGFVLHDEVLQADGDTVLVYKNTNFAGIGYAFDRHIPESVLDSMENPIDRQLAYGQFAVVEDENMLSLDRGEYTSAVKELDFEITSTDGVKIGESRIAASKNGKMHLEFNAPAETELYLMITDTRTFESRKKKAVHVSYDIDGATGKAMLTNINNNFTYEQDGLLLCMGYHDAEVTQCDISFSQKCKLDYGDIRLFCIPKDALDTTLAVLTKERLENAVVSDNMLSGEITVSAPSVLQISVPYSEGWSASVDGQDAGIFRCGGMYLGIELQEGSHNVVLKYRTPLLYEGAAISAVSLSVFIVLFVIFGLKKKKAA